MNTARRSLTGTASLGIASLGIGLLGTLSGCFNPTPPANVLCAPDRWCPSGQTCDTGRWLCVPNGQIPDAGWWFDSGWPPPPDGWYPWDAGPTEGIEAALAASPGPVYIAIKEVLVTYVKPPTDTEPEGFFVQSDPFGPAMLVAVSPSFSGVRLTAGDRVSFTVNEMSTLYANPIATYITELVVHSRGNDVSDLVQDVSTAYDLTINAQSFAAELVRAELTVEGTAYDDGYGFLVAQVETDAIAGDWALLVRLSSFLQRQVGLEDDCRFQVEGVPFWRYWSEAIFPIHDMSELRDVQCPAPRIVNTFVENDSTLYLELNRALDPATLVGDGSQFTIPGLTVLSAASDGPFLTLITTPHTPGQTYSLEVDGSVRDIFGGSIHPDSFPSFQGIVPRARVRINELKGNIAPSCDLLELRVIDGGILDTVTITEQGTPVHTFRNMLVARNDLIVIHFNAFSSPCNPGRSPSETQAANQHPRVVFGANFDTAYDIYVTSVGLETVPHTISLRDQYDNLMDIVLVAGNPSFAPDTTSEQEAANALELGQWRTLDGSTPPGGLTGNTFITHAAAGLDAGPVSVVNGWSAIDGQPSVQRSSNNDDNHKGDWTTAPHSFGVLNPGQNSL